MLMFALGIVALFGALFCLLAAAVMATSSAVTFVLAGLILGFAWWLSGKNWGIADATDEALAERARKHPLLPAHSQRAVVRRPMEGKTSLDEWRDEDAPL